MLARDVNTRAAAREALAHYDGLADARVRLLARAHNTLFRVDDGFVLRVHDSQEHSLAEIASELTWLDALCRDTDLIVPRPVRNRAGDWVTGRCTLLHWVPGRMQANRPRLVHFARVGRTIAALHEHADRWEPPDGFTRTHWTADALFGETGFIGAPGVNPWKLLPKEHETVYRQGADAARAAMAELDDPPHLIHADLHLWNTLFHDGRACAIDFDDTGFGLWGNDFAAALSYPRKLDAWPRILDAFCRGYADVRPVPREHIERLDALIAGRLAGLALWACCMDFIADDRPRLLQAWGETVARVLQAAK